jgi:hypothetical protein
LDWDLQGLVSGYFDFTAGCAGIVLVNGDYRRAAGGVITQRSKAITVTFRKAGTPARL